PTGARSVLQGLPTPADAAGLRVGSLIVTPSAGLATTYDSNVLATRKNGHSDWSAGFFPGLAINWDWSRQPLSLKAQGEFRRHETFGREDVDNVSLAATGRIDLAP